jgi:hypothetical protein
MAYWGSIGISLRYSWPMVALHQVGNFSLVAELLWGVKREGAAWREAKQWWGLAARIPKSLQRALKLDCVTVDTSWAVEPIDRETWGRSEPVDASGTVTRAEVQALLV